MTTILGHPFWPLLLPHLYIAQEATDPSEAEHRVEVHKTCPPAVLDIVVQCAHCGADIHPVRETKRNLWTFNASCPLAVKVGCARSSEATALLSAVREAMAGGSPQGNLFA